MGQKQAYCFETRGKTEKSTRVLNMAFLGNFSLGQAQSLKQDSLNCVSVGRPLVTYRLYVQMLLKDNLKRNATNKGHKITAVYLYNVSI